MMLSDKNQQKIQAALSTLLKQESQEAFLIIEEPKTQKFVQFAGGVDEPLLFDLPAQGLSENELNRAKEIFEKYGVEMQGHPIYEDDSMQKVIDTQYGFTAELGDAIDLGVELTSLVFTEIYQFDANINLQLEGH